MTLARFAPSLVQIMPVQIMLIVKGFIPKLISNVGLGNVFPLSLIKWLGSKRWHTTATADDVSINSNGHLWYSSIIFINVTYTSMFAKILFNLVELMSLIAIVILIFKIYNMPLFGAKNTFFIKVLHHKYSF